MSARTRLLAHVAIITKVTSASSYSYFELPQIIAVWVEFKSGTIINGVAKLIALYATITIALKYSVGS